MPKVDVRAEGEWRDQMEYDEVYDREDGQGGTSSYCTFCGPDKSDPAEVKTLTKIRHKRHPLGHLLTRCGKHQGAK